MVDGFGWGEESFDLPLYFVTDYVTLSTGFIINAFGDKISLVG